MKWRRCSIAVAVVPLLMGACDGGPEPQRPAPGVPLEAAIVPGANLVLEVDLQAARRAPVFPFLAAMAKDRDKSGAEAASGKQSASDKKKEAKPAADRNDFGERFLAGSGLKAEDFIALVVSAKIDPASLPPFGAKAQSVEAEPQEAEKPAAAESEAKGSHDGSAFDSDAVLKGLADSSFTLCILLAQDLDMERLEGALRGASDDPKETYRRLEVVGAQAIHVKSGKPGEPDGWFTILGGNTLFVTFSERDLAGAVQRATAGQPAETDVTLRQARAGLPEAAQAKLAFVVPEALRALIRERIDKAGEDPAAAAMSGFVTPFRNLQSVGLSMAAAEDLTVAMTYDLADEAVASQTQVTFSSMLLPMAQAGLAQALKRTPAEMADRIQITSQGTTLRIGYRMTREDMATFEEIQRQKKAAKAETEAIAKEHSEAPGE